MGIALGFDVLMRLIVAAAANEITMRCGRPVCVWGGGQARGAPAPESILSKLFSPPAHTASAILIQTRLRGKERRGFCEQDVVLRRVQPRFTRFSRGGVLA